MEILACSAILLNNDRCLRIALRRKNHLDVVAFKTAICVFNAVPRINEREMPACASLLYEKLF